MRVVELSNKVYLIRHWWRWYRVQRAGADWQFLVIKPRERTTGEIKRSLDRSLSKHHS